VVPNGLWRIRVQLSPGHEPAHIDPVMNAFTKVGKSPGIPGR
jgi:hypothetical protein